MKTLKEYYYTYYSYEEYGRGYFGSRGCECLPEEDINYFGSFRDKTFKPTQKIILGIYETREEAYADEIILHDYYDVANNPHFANRANATSTKFYVPIEKAKETGKKVAQNNKELGIGIFSFTSDKRSEMGKVGGTKSYQLGVGIHALTSEERKECGKMGLYDTSWENDEGDKITLIDLLNSTENIPVSSISVNKLKKYLLTWNGNNEELEKIEKSDLQYPILIFVEDDGSPITIIDGHHRVHKAIKNKLETINAKLIPINSLPKNMRKVFGYSQNSTQTIEFLI